jgi:hypothetical protein
MDQQVVNQEIRDALTLEDGLERLVLRWKQEGVSRQECYARLFAYLQEQPDLAKGRPVGQMGDRVLGWLREGGRMTAHPRPLFNDRDDFLSWWQREGRPHARGLIGARGLEWSESLESALVAVGMTGWETAIRNHVRLGLPYPTP